MSPTMPRIEEALKKALARLPAKPRVEELRYMIDVDPQGEEGLLVYVILADEDATPLPPRDELAPIENTIREAVAKVNDLWVYFRFRLSSEQKSEMKRGGIYVQPRRVSAA